MLDINHKTNSSAYSIDLCLLTLGKNPVEQVHEHWVLGVITDEELKWQCRIGNICMHLSKHPISAYQPGH